MISRLGLAALLSCILASSAFAVCPSPLTGKDAAGATQNFSIFVDAAGNCNSVVGPNQSTATLSVWSSGTGSGATQSLMSGPFGAPAVLLQLNQTTPITTGAITIEGTYDGTYTDGPGGVPRVVPVAQVLNPNTLAPLTNPYTLVPSTNQPFLILTQGYQAVRIRLTTTITGAGTVSPFTTLLSYNPVLGALLNPLAAGTAIIGKVGVDQTTPGTTNRVFAGDIIVTPSANFTRPANVTAYVAGQLVANSVTAGSVTPMSWTAVLANGGNFYVRRFRMTLSSKSITNTSFRLHLFTVTPATITNGDGGAFNVTEANEFCTMDALVSATDPLNWQAGADVSIGYGIPGKGNECNGVAAGGATTIFGLLEARAAYTPASAETITVIPEIHQN